MGIVYHANYLPWFEAARIDLMDSLGLPYKKITQMGFHIPVLEAHIKYLSSAKFDDRLEVIASLKERPGVRLKIEYSILHGNTELARGATSHAFVNAMGVPVKPPSEILNQLRKKFDESENLEK